MATIVEPNPPPRLIFDQKAWSPSRLRLALFLMVSAVGHLGVFYLFKVVTPLTTRRLPPEQSVLVLRGGDPESAQILASLEDRSPAGMLINLTPTAERDLPRLALSDYTPSYQGHQPDYKLNWEQPQQPLPGLAQSNRPLLPGLAVMAPPKQGVPGQNLPQLTLPTDLAERGLAEAPNWPTTLVAPEDSSEHYLIRLGIEPSGLVKYFLNEGSNLPANLQQTLEQLRFNPRSQPGLQWGEVELHWQAK